MENPSYKSNRNYSKNHLNCFKYYIFCSQDFSKTFHEYLYKNRKPESQNSLKLLKSGLNGFHKFFKKNS